MGTYVFVGAILVGIGVGMLFGQTTAGTLIGVGVGFIMWGLLDHRKKMVGDLMKRYGGKSSE